jgi:MoxR-like ATPase
MAAGRVSVDGTGHELPRPFLVIATQNGLDQGGTAPLPESQLDRFLMRLSLGFPERTAERSLLQGEALRPEAIDPQLGPGDLLRLQEQAAAVHASAALLDYLLDVLARSRDGSQRGFPLSPRAGLGLLAAARAWALIAGRDHVLPDDVQAVLAAVCEHRLDGGNPSGGAAELSRQLLAGVDSLR